MTGNIRIDSGYIDSHFDLGLNSPMDHRVLARHVLHRALPVTKGFSRNETTSVGNFTVYNYGNKTLPSGIQDYMAAVKSVDS
jgi:hypothetical protein